MISPASFTPYSAAGLQRGLDAAEAALDLWAQSFRTASDLSLWWTRKCIEAPAVMANLAQPFVRKASEPAAEPSAKPATELVQAVAARIAALPAETAEAVAGTTAEVVEETAGVVHAAAEELKAPADDLTRMVGIGPKLAAALAERGVTRFAQIAAWTDADLAEIDKSLDLKGRAVRDAWVAQARRFASEA